VSPEERLAQIVTGLEAAGLSCLVMGGHAVRYYGLIRNTIDFDLHLAPDAWDVLVQRLGQLSLFTGQSILEGPSWRPHAFRRFQIGRLPDGREEWLEFWRENHLLPPFAELLARCERGTYGGRELPFFALPDLMRSKETEREVDWQDIAALEEFHDARWLARVNAGALGVAEALAQMRSRRGFDGYLKGRHLANAVVVEQALSLTRLSIPQAYLLPFAPKATPPAPGVPLEPIIVNRLRTVTAGSPLHLTLVEAVRRQYKLAAQAADRADKQAIRAVQIRPPSPPG
jgi:hypothetical protein